MCAYPRTVSSAAISAGTSTSIAASAPSITRGPGHATAWTRGKVNRSPLLTDRMLASLINQRPV
ncbi:MAG: hypothetical protein NVSMB2_20480 [Chloroflexota bacterium]